MSSQRLVVFFVLIEFILTQLATPYALATNADVGTQIQQESLASRISRLENSIEQIRLFPNVTFARRVASISTLLVRVSENQSLTEAEKALLQKYITQKHRPLKNAIALAQTVSEISGQPEIREAVLVATMTTTPDPDGMLGLEKTSPNTIEDIAGLRIAQTPFTEIQAYEKGGTRVKTSPKEFGNQLASEIQKRLKTLAGRNSALSSENMKAEKIETLNQMRDELEKFQQIRDDAEVRNSILKTLTSASATGLRVEGAGSLWLHAKEFADANPGYETSAVGHILARTFDLFLNFVSPNVLTVYDVSILAGQISKQNSDTLLQFFHLMSPRKSIVKAQISASGQTGDKILNAAKENPEAQAMLADFLSVVNGIGNRKQVLAYLQNLQSEVIQKTSSLSYLTSGQDIRDIDSIRTIVKEHETMMLIHEPLLATDVIRKSKYRVTINEAVYEKALEEQAQAIAKTSKEIAKLTTELNNSTQEPFQLQALAKMMIIDPSDAWRITASDWKNLWALAQGYQYVDILKKKEEFKHEWVSTGATLMAFAVFFMPPAGEAGVGFYLAMTILAGVAATKFAWDIRNDAQAQYLRMRWTVIAGLHGDIAQADALLEKYKSAEREAILYGVISVTGLSKLAMSVQSVAGLRQAMAALTLRTAWASFGTTNVGRAGIAVMNGLTGVIAAADYTIANQSDCGPSRLPGLTLDNGEVIPTEISPRIVEKIERLIDEREGLIAYGIKTQDEKVIHEIETALNENQAKIRELSEEINFEGCENKNEGNYE